MNAPLARPILVADAALLPIPVRADTNEPTLRRGDVALVSRCSKFVGEGLYAITWVLGEVAFYQVSHSCKKTDELHLWVENKLYGHTAHNPLIFSREDFARCVVGKVAVRANILDHSIVPRLFDL